MTQSAEKDFLPAQWHSFPPILLQPALCLFRKMDREPRFFDSAQISQCSLVPNVVEKIIQTDTNRERLGLAGLTYWRDHWKVRVSSPLELPRYLQIPF